MEHIEHLPQEIRSVVRGFCSHPIADAIRPHVVGYKWYSAALATQTYPDANTFYLYFFTNKKLVNVMATLKEMQTLLGADVRCQSGHSARSCGLCTSKPVPMIL